MTQYAIAVIPGDGIGQEVAPEGMRVLDAAAKASGAFTLRYETFPWGCEYYRDNGQMMPDDGLDLLATSDAIYFGAVGDPALVPDHISLRDLLLKIRMGFDQYACIRPSILLPGIDSPLAGKTAKDIDFIVVRENTEGEYSGAGGRIHSGHPIETAVETAIFSRAGVTRIIAYAFDLAKNRPRKRLVSATKSNAIRHTLTMWDEIFDEVAMDYPEVTTERVLVDALAARMVMRPETLDVVVGSNLFGDILTDIGGAISGSLGLAASGNLNPERTYPSMFEPVHGSAPDIAGKGIANPIAMFWSGAMMLEFLGEQGAADNIMKAIRAITGEKKTLTRDLGGKATTREVTDAVIAKILG